MRVYTYYVQVIACETHTLSLSLSLSMKTRMQLYVEIYRVKHLTCTYYVLERRINKV